MAFHSSKTACLTVSLSFMFAMTSGQALADSTNPFGFTMVDQHPYQQLAEGKCGASKCGGDQTGEAKCGASKCGGDKKSDAKCGASKCGGQ